MSGLSSLLGVQTQETLEQKKERFYSVFGRFVTNCAAAEESTQIHLAHLMKIASWKTKALIGGAQISTIITVINRVAPKAIKSAAKRKELKALLDHLNEIADLRNALVHRTISFSESEFHANDFHSAKVEEKAKEIRFQTDHIEQANLDLICLNLRLHILRGAKLKLGKEEREFLFAPWRYKRLEQRNLWNRLLADALRRRRPPQSSPQ